MCFSLHGVSDKYTDGQDYNESNGKKSSKLLKELEFQTSSNLKLLTVQAILSALLSEMPKSFYEYYYRNMAHFWRCSAFFSSRSEFDFLRKNSFALATHYTYSTSYSHPSVMILKFCFTNLRTALCDHSKHTKKIRQAILSFYKTDITSCYPTGTFMMQTTCTFMADLCTWNKLTWENKEKTIEQCLSRKKTALLFLFSSYVVG